MFPFLEKRRFTLCLLLFFSACSCLTGAEVVHLAIVAPAKEMGETVDLLTAEFSMHPGLALLERREIDRVWREQSLSANFGKDFLKLGQLLGADGILYITREEDVLGTAARLRLIGVRAGVALGEAVIPGTSAQASEGAKRLFEKWHPLFLKLKIPKEQALKISLLGLHAALPTAGEASLERQIGRLLVERLLAEPSIFVLERERLTELGWEKEFLNEETFWTGSYLLEGAINPEGRKDRKLTILAQLTAPGQKPVPVRVENDDGSVGKVVEELVRKVLSGISQELQSSWRAEDEANRYFEEAQWAQRWKLWPRAASAAEASWALGNRSVALAELRLQIAAPQIHGGGGLRTTQIGSVAVNSLPNPDEIPIALTALNLVYEMNEAIAATNAVVQQRWMQTVEPLVAAAGAFLRKFYFAVEAREGNEERLRELRAAGRSALAAIQKLPESVREDAVSLEATWGVLFQETPEQTVDMYRRLLLGPYGLSLFAEIFEREEARSILAAAWTFEDYEKGPLLMKSLAAELVGSTNKLAQLKGHLLRMILAKSYTDLDAALRDAVGSILELDAPVQVHEYNPIERVVEIALDHRVLELERHQPTSSPIMKAQIKRFFAAERPRLAEWSKKQKEVLQRRDLVKDILSHLNGTQIPLGRFHALPSGIAFTEADRAVLLPEIEKFRKRLLAQSSATPAERHQLQISSNELRQLETKLSAARTLPAASSSAGHQLSSAPALPPSRPVVAAPNRSPAKIPAEMLIPIEGEPSKTIERVPLWQSADKDSIIPDSYFQGGLSHGGMVWLEGTRAHEDDRLDTVIVENFLVEIDLKNRKSRRLISLPQRTNPSRRAEPGPVPCRFAVSETSVHLATQSGLDRYDFQTGRWSSLPVPIEGGARLFRFGDRWIASGAESILAWKDGAEREVTLLASVRRRPASSPLDNLSALDYPLIWPGKGEDLYTIVRENVFYFDARNRTWTQAGPAPGKVIASLADGALLVFLPNYGKPALRKIAGVPPVLSLLVEGDASSFSPAFPPAHGVASSPPAWRLGKAAEILPRASVAHHENTVWLFSEIFGAPARSGDVLPGSNVPGPIMGTAAEKPRQFVLAALPSDRPVGVTRQVELALPDASVRNEFPGVPVVHHLIPTPEGLLVIRQSSPGFWLLPNALLKNQFGTTSLPATMNTQALLEKFDHNRNGQLDPAEKAEMVDDSGFLFRSWAEIDRDNSKRLEGGEAFFFDVNRDGRIDVREWMGMEKVQFTLANACLSQWDSNHDGGLDETELVAMLVTMNRNSPGMTRPDMVQLDGARQLLERFDASRDGALDGVEMKAVLVDYTYRSLKTIQARVFNQSAKDLDDSGTDHERFNRWFSLGKKPGPGPLPATP